MRPLRKQLDAAADAEVEDPALRQLLAMRIARAASSAELLAPLLGGATVPLETLLARVPRELPALRAALRCDRAVTCPATS